MKTTLAILAILFIMFLYTRSHKTSTQNTKKKNEIYVEGSKKTRGIDTE